MKIKDNPFGVDKDEDSAGFLLWQVTNLWQREIRKALEKHDLTPLAVCIAGKHVMALASKTKRNAGAAFQPHKN